MDCVFCKIRDGQIPSFKIHEDERTLTFMDINPLNSGHCLVATKAHAATIHETDVEDLKAVMVTAKKVAAVIQQALVSVNPTISTDQLGQYMRELFSEEMTAQRELHQKVAKTHIAM